MILLFTAKNYPGFELREGLRPAFGEPSFSVHLVVSTIESVA